tara:strand:- start:213 stop:449 length:237 start_codon:yes stop_codon:yes gene_type:complete
LATIDEAGTSQTTEPTTQTNSKTYVCDGCKKTFNKGNNFRRYREVKTASGEYVEIDPFVYWSVCRPCGDNAIKALANS